MNQKRTLFFLGVLLFLVAFYYLTVHRKPSGENVFSFSPEVKQATVLALENKEQVNRLTINDTEAGTSLSLEREKDGSWQVVQPVRYPAEPIVANGFVSLLKLTPRLRQLSFDPSQAEEFGLDRPRLSVCVSTNLKSKMQCLSVGSDAAIAEGVYARWEHEPRYFLIDSKFLKAFDKTLYSVRKKQVFTLSDQEVTGVQFRSSKQEFKIEKKGEEWMLLEPVKAVLGADAVSDLLVRLNELYVKDFLDPEDFKNSKLDLERGVRVIRITFRDGSRETLIQGREAAGRDAYYARKETADVVLLIAIGKLDRVEETFRKLIA